MVFIRAADFNRERILLGRKIINSINNALFMLSIKISLKSGEGVLGKHVARMSRILVSNIGASTTEESCKILSNSKMPIS